MKGLTAALIGTGAGAVVLLAYLALGQQQETRKDIQVDKAAAEVSRAKFDKDFDQAWTSFDGKKPSKETQEAHDKRIADAQKGLDEARAALGSASERNAQDLADMKAAIDAMDKEPGARK
jgi:hypothetical protein